MYDHLCEMKNNTYAGRCNSHTHICVYVRVFVQTYTNLYSALLHAVNY